MAPWTSDPIGKLTTYWNLLTQVFFLKNISNKEKISNLL